MVEARVRASLSMVGCQWDGERDWYETPAFLQAHSHYFVGTTGG